MSNNKFEYRVLRKGSDIVLADNIPTRKISRDVKRRYTNAKIEQFKYQLIGQKVVR